MKGLGFEGGGDIGRWTQSSSDLIECLWAALGQVGPQVYQGLGTPPPLPVFVSHFPSLSIPSSSTPASLPSLISAPLSSPLSHPCLSPLCPVNHLHRIYAVYKVSEHYARLATGRPSPRLDSQGRWQEIAALRSGAVAALHRYCSSKPDRACVWLYVEACVAWWDGMCDLWMWQERHLSGITPPHNQPRTTIPYTTISCDHLSRVPFTTTCHSPLPRVVTITTPTCPRHLPQPLLLTCGHLLLLHQLKVYSDGMLSYVSEGWRGGNNQASRSLTRPLRRAIKHSLCRGRSLKSCASNEGRRCSLGRNTQTSPTRPHFATR
ncbi:hypothetical protein O3P69_013977 [Scylla paramamosain]|uniref:Uncharacterized protein n=1 Tax=Scylla paramamosain TaxID=85552 RepID=A0AAW0SRS0_SCYPA